MQGYIKKTGKNRYRIWLRVHGKKKAFGVKGVTRTSRIWPAVRGRE